MIEQGGGGRIINITSMTAHRPTRFIAHYAASKNGVIGLTKVLALELSDYRITVNAVSAGIIRTDTAEGIYGQGTEEQKEQFIQMMVPRPRGRAGGHRSLCAFLASDAPATSRGGPGGWWVHDLKTRSSDRGNAPQRGFHVTGSRGRERVAELQAKFGHPARHRSIPDVLREEFTRTSCCRGSARRSCTSCVELDHPWNPAVKGEAADREGHSRNFILEDGHTPVVAFTRRAPGHPLTRAARSSSSATARRSSRCASSAARGGSSTTPRTAR
jgi:hypothetical protein